MITDIYKFKYLDKDKYKSLHFIEINKKIIFQVILNYNFKSTRFR